MEKRRNRISDRRCRHATAPTRGVHAQPRTADHGIVPRPDLRIDWRTGARHFFDLLVDGDVANNVGNWQWVAGTGANPRPGRAFNPIRQARRFDPNGNYVRRYVPELATIEGGAVHEPWKLRENATGYPTPIVDRA